MHIQIQIQANITCALTCKWMMLYMWWTPPGRRRVGTIDIDIGIGIDWVRSECRSIIWGCGCWRARMRKRSFQVGILLCFIRWAWWTFAVVIIPPVDSFHCHYCITKEDDMSMLYVRDAASRKWGWCIANGAHRLSHYVLTTIQLVIQPVVSCRWGT